MAYAGARYGDPPALDEPGSTGGGTPIRNSEPIQLVLSRGKPLLVRVTDEADQPIPRARVWVNPRVPATRSPDDVVPRLRLDGNTDAEGRVSFAHVPELDGNSGADGDDELSGDRIGG